MDVAVTTLDALIARFGVPAFIKIDVEGAEPDVLAGLSHAVPVLSFEYLPRALALAVAMAFAPLAQAGMNEAKQWVDKEFQPSVLTKAQQLKEMEWFVNAAKPFKGREINVLSGTIPTHEYES